MFESMIIRVITFFSDIGVWFKRNFFPHTPHAVKETPPQFVDEFIVQPIEPVTKIKEEATSQVQTAKEFMQQSIEIVSKAEEELKAKIIEDVKHVEDVVAQYKEDIVETIKEEVSAVAEVVEETAKKVKRATRKKAKKEQED